MKARRSPDRKQPNRKRLNELLIRRLQPLNTPYLIWDTTQKGLVIRVETTGFASFKCIYARNGRPRWYSIAPVNAIGLAEARKLAGRIMYQVAEGGDPCADRKAQRSQGAFEELARAYVEQYAKKRNKSWAQADYLVKKNLLPKWGKLKAADIVRSDVTAMMARIESPSLGNQVLAAASAIFSWAIREEVSGVKVNPCAKVERNATRSRERILSDVELPRFWKAFGEADFVRGRALMMLLLTGQRPGEVRHMRAEHIENGWWTLPGQASEVWPGTKNGQTHRVWLPKPAQNILTEMEVGREGFVFAGPRGNPVAGLEEVTRDICERLEVERATPHDLRRTHGSTITRLGYGRDAMNRIQNHAEGGIATVYDRHAYSDENKAIMERVAAKLVSIVDGKDDNIVAFAAKVG